MISLILIVVALILFILGAIPVNARFNLVSAGLACMAAAMLVGRWPIA